MCHPVPVWVAVVATTLLHEGAVLPGKYEPSAAATQSAANALSENVISEAAATAWPTRLMACETAPLPVSVLEVEFFLVALLVVSDTATQVWLCALQTVWWILFIVRSLLVE